MPTERRAATCLRTAAAARCSGTAVSPCRRMTYVSAVERWTRSRHRSATEIRGTPAPTGTRINPDRRDETLNNPRNGSVRWVFRARTRPRDRTWNRLFQLGFAGANTLSSVRKLPIPGNTYGDTDQSRYRATVPVRRPTSRRISHVVRGVRPARFFAASKGVVTFARITRQPFRLSLKNLF